MPETTAVKVAYFAAGAAVVAAVAAVSVFGVLKFGAGGAGGDDEERPPIIVRGGSIEFESGDKKNGEKGKPWKEVKKNRYWQSEHPGGIPVSKFTLQIEADDQNCPTFDETQEATFTYKEGSRSTFIITTRVENGKTKRVPTIIGSNLKTGGTPDYPQLTFGNAGGSITHLRFIGMLGSVVDCENVKTVTIWQDQ